MTSEYCSSNFSENYTLDSIQSIRKFQGKIPIIILKNNYFNGRKLATSQCSYGVFLSTAGLCYWCAPHANYRNFPPSSLCTLRRDGGRIMTLHHVYRSIQRPLVVTRHEWQHCSILRVRDCSQLKFKSATRSGKPNFLLATWQKVPSSLPDFPG